MNGCRRTRYREVNLDDQGENILLDDEFRGRRVRITSRPQIKQWTMEPLHPRWFSNQTRPKHPFGTVSPGQLQLRATVPWH